jgi:hypothetical protein
MDVICDADGVARDALAQRLDGAVATGDPLRLAARPSNTLTEGVPRTGFWSGSETTTASGDPLALTLTTLGRLAAALLGVGGLVVVPGPWLRSRALALEPTTSLAARPPQFPSMSRKPA